MIYIISGASRSGKTLIGKRMMKEKNIPYISTDYLMMGFMHGVKEMEIHDKLWPDQIALKMWRFLEPYIETIIYNQEDYIIEGEALLPDLVKQLMEKHPGKISACFVGYVEANISKKIEDIKKYASQHDWLVPLGDAEIKNHVSNMKSYSKKIQEIAIKNGVPYIDISSDFDKKINEVLDTLTNDYTL